MFKEGQVYRIKERGTDNPSWWGFDLMCIKYELFTDTFHYRVFRTNPNGGMQEVGREGTIKHASRKLMSILNKKSPHPDWL